MALRADGNAPNITAFLSRESVASVSGQGGVPTRPHTSEENTVSASQASIRALWRWVWVSAGFASPGLKTALIMAPVMHPRYGHSLRFYIRPHFRKCGAVVALKLHLVPHTAARPHGFPKQALCKVAYAGVGRTAVGAPRSRVHALRAAVCTPLWCASTVALVRRSALRFDQWPAASHVVSAPPTLGLAAARHWPARSARPPPRGSLRTARGSLTHTGK